MKVNLTGNKNDSFLYLTQLRGLGLSMFVCVCHGVSDKKIRKLVVEEGVTDIKGIKKCTALGSQCGKCVRMAKEIINESAVVMYKQAS